MNATRRLVSTLSILLCVAGLAAQRGTREPVTVMSFNIRYGSASDGGNAWNARREMLFEVIRQHDADLVGLQEALDFQIDEIIAAIPAYAVIGVGRDDGKRAGEYSAILFRKDRFRLARAGTFWFSDTPDVPRSKSWGNNITRICTWARLVDRNGRGLWLYNLHLDHESQPSRVRSTQLLRERIEARSPEEPVIVTGDFNVGEDNPAMHTLLGEPAADSNSTSLLVDTFRALHPTEGMAGTYNAFEYGNVEGDKIDYILVTPGTEVIHAEIVRTSRDNRYPSDHFPVVARVRLADH